MKDLRYYEEVFPLAIHDSRPIPCGDTRGYEVHILTSEQDHTMALWALKSFYHSLGERPKLVVHDDGTMTGETVRVFQRHFPRCTVVRTDPEDRLRDSLSGLPLCELWRFRCHAPLARKLFDFPSHATEPFIVGIDSDLLFFRKPLEILECTRASIPFMACDYQDAYEFDAALARSADESIALVPRLNSGLFGMHAAAFDFTLVETLLASWVNASPARRFPYWRPWLEQTLMACLFSKSADKRVLDLSRYQISSMLLGDQTVSQHFVKDGSRSAFYHWGLRRLHETGFLEAIA